METSSILVSAPYRLTFGGGGTDFLPYASRFGGYTLTSTVSQRLYVLLSSHAYSAQPDTEALPWHHTTHRALNALGLSGYQIATLGELPAGAGLGSSGAFFVGLVSAQTCLASKPLEPSDVAARAFRLETEDLQRPTGPQDCYASALGGFIEQYISARGQTQTKSLPIDPFTLQELGSRLLLLDTRKRRQTEEILARQVAHVSSMDAQTIQSLHVVKNLALEARAALLAGELDELGNIFLRQWKAKIQRDPYSTDSDIQRLYELAVSMGATGAKLVGAGGGGYLLLMTRAGQREKVALKLRGAGCSVIEVDLGAGGCRVEWAQK